MKLIPQGEAEVGERARPAPIHALPGKKPDLPFLAGDRVLVHFHAHADREPRIHGQVFAA